MGEGVFFGQDEIIDSVKEKAIAEFLGLQSLSLQQHNVSADKEYADAYRSFITTIKLPPSYVDKMHTAKYTKHFYTPEEIQRFSDKWLKR